MDRPGPPITVSVPGRGVVASELLAVGPPPARRPPLPGPQRWSLLAVLLVLSAGVVAATVVEPPPPPPPARPVPPSVAVGVTAEARTVAGVVGQPLVARLGLDVRVLGSTGRGDSAPVPEPVRLLELRARGFVLVLVGAPLPQEVAGLTRDGASVGFDVEARIVDCSVEVQAPRRLELVVQRGTGAPVAVRVAADAAVVRALDELTARSCRRPRG